MNKHSSGFTLIEVVLALAMTALVAAGITTGLLMSERGLARVSGDVKARGMLQECAAVSRWMRDAGILASASEGTHGLVLDAGSWALSGQSDQDDFHGRNLEIIGTDPGQRTVVCHVAWLLNDQPASVSSETIVSR